MTDELQQSIQQAQATIDRLYDETRVYIPALMGQLAKTYAPPLIAIFIVGTLGATFFIQLGGQSGNLTAMILNVLILVFGFRWTENRFRGTALFVAYITVTRTRRALQAAMEADDAAPTIIDEHGDQFVMASEGFIKVMQALGAQPVELESD